MLILREAVLDRSRRKKDTYWSSKAEAVFREGSRGDCGQRESKANCGCTLKNIYAKVESILVVNGMQGVWFKLHTGVCKAIFYHGS